MKPTWPLKWNGYPDQTPPILFPAELIVDRINVTIEVNDRPLPLFSPDTLTFRADVNRNNFQVEPIDCQTRIRAQLVMDNLDDSAYRKFSSIILEVEDYVEPGESGAGLIMQLMGYSDRKIKLATRFTRGRWRIICPRM